MDKTPNLTEILLPMMVLGVPPAASGKTKGVMLKCHLILGSRWRGVTVEGVVFILTCSPRLHAVERSFPVVIVVVEQRVCVV